MKKIWLCMITILAVVSLSACSTSPKKDNSSSDKSFKESVSLQSESESLSKSYSISESESIERQSASISIAKSESESKSIAESSASVADSISKSNELASSSQEAAIALERNSQDTETTTASDPNSRTVYVVNNGTTNVYWYSQTAIHPIPKNPVISMTEGEALAQGLHHSKTE
ncbi:hypothetical protein [Lactococcus lactis]|jgi:uncharacterized lipoprotein|uniref:hypothetical protein n=1 Tax=Lactococcus lactis TaxID=1358 RepID=UPI00102199A0|nr:hypothetical protein [Lactococcus lactis]QBC37203.1 hypothetical protein EQZ99_03930 [Lactococcus lactis]UCS90071.1 hypothetical protein H0A38_10450 [Lactococcus lactis]